MMVEVEVLRREMRDARLFTSYFWTIPTYVDSSTNFAVEANHHRRQSHFSLCLRCVTMVDVGGSLVGGG
eukprot:scaffold40730_cov117-Skeletonema_dohrnii-CCMP3373.AAC.1